MDNQLCKNHGIQLTHYCNNCNEPICFKCKDIHVSHKLVSISSEFLDRMEKIEDKVKNDLQRKHNGYLNQQKNFNHLLKNINSRSTLLNFDLQNQMEQDMKHLQLELGKNISIFQNELKNLQRSLMQIQDIQSFFQKIEQNQIQTAGSYQFLQDKIGILLISQPKQLSQFDPLNFNILTEDKMNLLSKDGLNEYTQFQNNIIIQLQQEIKDELKRPIEQFHIDNIQFQIQLNQKILTKINSDKIICAYCGEFQNQEIINDYCIKNNIKTDLKSNLNFAKDENAQYFTQVEPTRSKNNRKHFFGVPKQEYFPVFNQYIKPFKTTDLYNSFLPQIKFIVNKIKTQLLIKHEQFDELFQGRKMKKIPFQYKLLEVLDIEQEECILLMKFLLVDDQIDLFKLKIFMNDKEFIENYHQELVEDNKQAEEIKNPLGIKMPYRLK